MDAQKIRAQALLRLGALSVSVNEDLSYTAQPEDIDVSGLSDLEAIVAEETRVADLVAYAADARWRKEVGGIVVGGVPIATDDRSKQMIIGARLAADADPNWSTQWVGADGGVHPVNAAAMIAISDAVQAHVNACFVTYAAVKSDIDAGDITTTQEIDAAFAA